MSIWPRPTAATDKVFNELSTDEESLQRWQVSLDSLQRGAEAALGLPGTPATLEAPAHSTAAWGPPADLGPLPEILQERARTIMALQQRAVDMLATSRADVEHEMTELARPRRQVRPVYVDVTG